VLRGTHGKYSEKNQDAIPTVFEFEKLKELADGVPLATILHPDANWKEERALETKRGKQAKNKAKDKHSTKTFKRDWLPLVLVMKARGKSISEITKRIRKVSEHHISEMTIKKWISQ
jgi:hypothetical protein